MEEIPANIGPSPDREPQTGPPEQWNRVNKACQECNRKKAKCDMRRPTCSRCERSGTACIVAIRQRTSRRRSVISKAMKMRLVDDHLDDLLKFIGSNVLEQDDSLRNTRNRERTADSTTLINEESILSNGKSAMNRPLYSPNREPISLVDEAGHVATQGGTLESWVKVNEGKQRQSSTDFSSVSSSRSAPLQPHLMLGVNQAGNDWNVPGGLLENLVDTFFEMVQSWLLLFHRPTFYQKYMPIVNGQETIIARSKVNAEEELMLNSMFALASRFSTATYFGHDPPADRGVNFALRATTLHRKLTPTVDEPTLDYINGCILLAFYHYTSGSFARGSLLTGMCVRFAYDIGLNNIDRDIIRADRDEHSGLQWSSVEEWVYLEGLRRTWWAIWELDTFGATVSCRPYSIDRRRSDVLLPVSDANWFASIPVASAFLGCRPNTAWKSLQGCPNQDARAWFLLSNHLMAFACDAAQQATGIPAAEKKELESALCCFDLALPAQFHLSSFHFDHENFARSNWIVSTHLMIQMSRICMGIVKVSEDKSSLGAIEMANSAIMNQVASELLRITNIWSAEYIPMNLPFIACCLVSPGARFVQNHISIEPTLELSKLVLSHYARYWRVGQLMLLLVDILESGKELTLDTMKPNEKEIVQRFAFLLPADQVRWNSAPVSMISCKEWSIRDVGSDKGTEDMLNSTSPLTACPQDHSECNTRLEQSQHNAIDTLDQKLTSANSERRTSGPMDILDFSLDYSNQEWEEIFNEVFCDLAEPRTE